MEGAILRVHVSFRECKGGQAESTGTPQHLFAIVLLRRAVEDSGGRAANAPKDNGRVESKTAWPLQTLYTRIQIRLVLIYVLLKDMSFQVRHRAYYSVTS